MCFVGHGLGWAMVNLTTDAKEVNGYLTLAIFHIAFILNPFGGGLRAQLYSSDEWKEVTRSFDDDDRRGRNMAIRRYGCRLRYCKQVTPLAGSASGAISRPIEEMTWPPCASESVDMSPAPEGVVAPASTWARAKIHIEAECLQGDGSYSGDFSGWDRSRAIDLQGFSL